MHSSHHHHGHSAALGLPGTLASTVRNPEVKISREEEVECSDHSLGWYKFQSLTRLDWGGTCHAGLSVVSLEGKDLGKLMGAVLRFFLQPPHYPSHSKLTHR